MTCSEKDMSATIDINKIKLKTYCFSKLAELAFLL
jgi:hypothetical protein